MKVETEELKTVAEIARHFPTKNGIGTSTNYIYRLMNDGRLVFDSVEIGTQTFYIIPLEDQKKEDWGLKDRLDKEQE